MTICSTKPLSCKMLSTSVGSIILIPQGAYYLLRYRKVHTISSDSARCVLSPQIAQGAYYFLRYGARLGINMEIPISVPNAKFRVGKTQ